MCPRRLGGIQKLFEQAGGDVALNHAKNYTRDPHHLVLLNGFRWVVTAAGPGGYPEAVWCVCMYISCFSLKS